MPNNTYQATMNMTLEAIALPAAVSRNGPPIRNLTARAGADPAPTQSPAEHLHPSADDALHRALLQEVSRAGCFLPAHERTVAYGAFILMTYAASCAVLLSDPGVVLRVLAIVSLAFISVQAGSMAHAAGHGAVTRNRRAAGLLGQLFHTLLTGMSYSYFQHIHRQHHPHCNNRSRDPDMQSSAFSMYPESALSKTGLGRFISRHQAFLVWILIGLQGFTLKIDGLVFLWRHPRGTRLDQFAVLLHVALWLVAPVLLLGVADALLNYGLITLLIGYYVGAIFLVNHIGTRVIEPDESISFFMREISVTRNLGDSWLADFLFIGVNNHIEHHLFPAMPTARLSRARHITRSFLHAHGIAYREMSWLAAAREVTGHLKAMSSWVPR